MCCYLLFLSFESVSEFPTTTSTLPKLELKVWNTGELWWSMPCLVKTFCKIDLTLYPFDTQRCDMEVSVVSRHIIRVMAINKLWKLNLNDLFHKVIASTEFTML